MRFLGKLIKWIFILFLALLLVGLGYYLAVTRNAKLSDEKLALTEKNVILYDNDGERFTSTYADFIGQTVSFDDLPTHTIKAFVDTEDKRFFSHNGFDYKRIVKSAYNNLRARSFKQGASTISQQLIKNTHLSQEKTLKRKLSEWKLTKQLEKRYSKQEIIEKYLSVIYFGHSCFGLRSASDFYFGKTPQELDIADSAILAGLVKSPNNYSPFKNPENCQRRKISVLTAMKNNGSISEQEYAQAKEKPLPIAPNRNACDGYAQHVFDELSALSDLHGFTVGGKIEILTYLDKEAQGILSDVAKSHVTTDKIFCILDPKTNGFKGCVSSVGEMKRLPGSLLKPLLVYAPAIEENLLAPATPILDEKIDYQGYSPQNYDGKFHGFVSVREALAKSYNIPAVKILDSLGIEKATAYLGKLGLSVQKDDYSLALALGGMKNGYTLPSLVNAYATFVNRGEFCSGGFIKEIKINGATVYKKSERATQVFSEETAYLTTDILQTAVQSGTAKKLRGLSFPIASKTGTVGTENGNTDAYAIAYTPKDVVGIWLGNADNSFIDYTGGGLPCQYLFEIENRLQKLYENTSQSLSDFEKPSGILRVNLDKVAYESAHTLLLADSIAPADLQFSELFKKDNIPNTQAEYLSNPKIKSPTVSLQDGKVHIRFPEDCPPFYEYTIRRNDKIIYQGAYTPVFIDDKVEKEKRYVYTVTPVYKERIGVCITLPTVSTKQGEKTILEEKKLLEKSWWED